MRSLFAFLLSLSFAFSNAQIINVFPYLDDFEGTGTAWTAPGTNNVWERGTPSKAVINGAYSGVNAWATDLDANYPNNKLQSLESPLFNFTSLSQPPYLRFKYNMKTESCCDILRIDFTVDDQNWINIALDSTGQNWYNDSTVNYWSGNSNGWKIASHRLDALPQAQNVRFRFQFFSDYSQNDEGFAIDDFEIVSDYTDVGLDALVSPKTSSCDFNQDTVKVSIQNLGQSIVGGININYQLDTNLIVSETISSLDADTSIIYSFSQSIDLSQDTIYNLKIWISAPGDSEFVNDTLSYIIENLVALDQFPYVEDFENGQGDWKSGGINSTWVLDEPTKALIRGAASGENAWVTGNSGFGFYNNNEKSYVESPCFNTTNLSTAQIRLSLWWESESGYDGANLEYTINDGQTWNVLNNSNAINWYNDTDIDGLDFASSKSGWSGNDQFGNGSGSYLTGLINENQLTGHSSLRLRVNFGSDVNTRDEGIAFDNFSLSETAATDLSLNGFNQDRFDQCVGASDSLWLYIQNFGASSLSNFGIQYEVGIQTGLANYSGNLGVGAIDSIFLTQLNQTDTGVFQIRAFHTIVGDTYPINDTSIGVLRVYGQKSPLQISPLQICDSSRALLGGISDGLVRWYTDSAREHLVFIGDTFLTGQIVSDTTFYTANTVGVFDTLEPANRFFGTGSNSNVTSRTMIEVKEAMTLVSAIVYVSGNGSFDVSIDDEFGQQISNRNIKVIGGTRRVYIGADLLPGRYTIRIDNFSTISLYRNTSGADYGNYKNEYFAMLGNTVDPEFYYYLYDLRVAKSEPCYGLGSVSLTRGNIVAKADYTFKRQKNKFSFYNTSQSARSFTWIFENLTSQSIDSSSATNPEISFDSGEYKITLIARSNCGNDTLIRNFVIDEISFLEILKVEDKTLRIYPNPASSYFRWNVNSDPQEFKLEIFDIMGRQIHSEYINTNSGEINTSNWKKGYYFLVLKSSDLNRRTKILIQ